MNKPKFWRLEIQLSQYELAAESGIPRHRIQLIEQGIKEVTKDETIAFANALGIEPQQIARHYFKEKSA